MYFLKRRQHTFSLLLALALFNSSAIMMKGAEALLLSVVSSRFSTSFLSTAQAMNGEFPYNIGDDLDSIKTIKTSKKKKNLFTRRSAGSAAAALAFWGPLPVLAKCTDIESCREIGDKKIETNMKENPTTVLNSGVRYKVLQPGAGGDVTVNEGSSVELIYSISEGRGAYMYSKGFGYEKIDFGGKKQSDLGLDSLRIVVGQKNVPVGIEQAMIGMKRGERRRIELPPNVGFETSNWQPEPTTSRGKASIVGYRRILEGFGSQPAFPAVTIWDVEVLRTRNKN